MNINLLNSLVTFVVGLFAFVIYFLNKREQVKTGAILVLNEIRNAEKCFKDYSTNKDFLKFVPQSISTDSWSRYQHLLSSRFDEDQRQEIIKFFENIIAFKQIITEWRQLHSNSLSSKTNKMQEKLIDLAHESNGDNENYEIKKKQITDIIHSDPYWFEPNMFKTIMEQIMSNYGKISTSTTGQKLKDIAKGRFLF